MGLPAAGRRLVLLALAAPLHGQSFGFPWWKDAQFQKELALTADQSARIDTIFQSTISAAAPEERRSSTGRKTSCRG